MMKGAPRTRKDWWLRLQHRLRFLGRSVVVINDTPHRIALGVALGTFIAYQPVVGFQMLISAVMALVLRANIPASLPPAWITNPVTIPPIFYLTYRLGALFTGGSKTLSEIKQVFLVNIPRAFEAGWLSGIKRAVAELAQGLFWPMIIGGSMVGVVNAILFYWLAYRAVTSYQRNRARRIANWASGRIEPPPEGTVEKQGDQR